jgi:hypothetical protein
MECRNYLGLLFGPLLLFSVMPAHGAMYKWYDEQGNLNYTQTPPPPGSRREQINTDSFSSVDMYKAPAVSLSPQPRKRSSPTKPVTIKKKPSRRSSRSTCRLRR